MVQDNCMKYPWTMFNPLRLSDAYMRHETKPSLIQIMACRPAGASHYLNQCGITWIGPRGTNFYEILIITQHFHSRNNLVIISTTTKFCTESAELITMTGELISVSHARWIHSCQSLYLLKYPLGVQCSPSTWVFRPLLPCHLITKKARNSNVCLSHSYNPISHDISAGQFHITGNNK